MKKLNRTYLAGIACLVLAVWIAWQTSMIPERMVSNEPGPKLFPYISALGIGVMAILMMIFDGPKDAEKAGKPYLDKAGWIRLAVIMGECLIFVVGMWGIGFLPTSILGMMMFIWTLKGDKKINPIFAIALSVALGCLCYFGFTRGFKIPLPDGELWELLGL